VQKLAVIMPVQHPENSVFAEKYSMKVCMYTMHLCGYLSNAYVAFCRNCPFLRMRKNIYSFKIIN